MGNELSSNIIQLNNNVLMRFHNNLKSQKKKFKRKTLKSAIMKNDIKQQSNLYQSENLTKIPSVQLLEREQLVTNNYQQQVQRSALQAIRSINKLNYGKYRLLCSKITNQYVQQYRVSFQDENQLLHYLISYFWRKSFKSTQPLVQTTNIKLSDRSKSLLKGGFHVFIHKSCSLNNDIHCKVYIEQIPLRLTHIKDIPFPQNLYVLRQVLKGFQIIYHQVGYVTPCQDLICITRKGIVKVWLNTDLCRNYPNIEHLQENIYKSQSKLVNQILHLLNSNNDPENEQVDFITFLKDKSVNLEYLTFKKLFQMLLVYQIQFNVEIPGQFNSIIQYLNQEEQQYDTYKDDLDQQSCMNDLSQQNNRKNTTFRRSHYSKNRNKSSRRDPSSSINSNLTLIQKCSSIRMKNNKKAVSLKSLNNLTSMRESNQNVNNTILPQSLINSNKVVQNQYIPIETIQSNMNLLNQTNILVSNTQKQQLKDLKQNKHEQNYLDLYQSQQSKHNQNVNQNQNSQVNQIINQVNNYFIQDQQLRIIDQYLQKQISQQLSQKQLSEAYLQLYENVLEQEQKKDTQKNIQIIQNQLENANRQQQRQKQQHPNQKALSIQNQQMFNPIQNLRRPKITFTICSPFNIAYSGQDSSQTLNSCGTSQKSLKMPLLPKSKDEPQQKRRLSGYKNTVITKYNKTQGETSPLTSEITSKSSIVEESFPLNQTFQFKIFQKNLKNINQSIVYPLKVNFFYKVHQNKDNYQIDNNQIDNNQIYNNLQKTNYIYSTRNQQEQKIILIKKSSQNKLKAKTFLPEQHIQQIINQQTQDFIEDQDQLSNQQQKIDKSHYNRLISNKPARISSNKPPTRPSIYTIKSSQKQKMFQKELIEQNFSQQNKQKSKNNNGYRFVSSTDQNKFINIDESQKFYDDQIPIENRYISISERQRNTKKINQNQIFNNQDKKLYNNQDNKLFNNQDNKLFNNQDQNIFTHEDEIIEKKQRKYSNRFRPITGRTVNVTTQYYSNSDLINHSQIQSQMDYTYKSFQKWKDASKIVQICHQTSDQQDNIIQPPFFNRLQMKTQLQAQQRHGTHRQLIKSSIQGENHAALFINTFDHIRHNHQQIQSKK